MRLSEAIRLGAMLHPQHFGCLATYRDASGRFAGYDPTHTTVAATCALGAARQAGFDTDSIIGDADHRCPRCGLVGNLPGVVIHLNDGHRWTRDRIADWVEKVERAEDLKRADAGATETVAAWSSA